MAKIPSEIAKKINLDLSKVPRGKRKEVKRQVGEFVVGEILNKVSQGISPVAKRGSFKKLNSKYAKDEKGGDTRPNLELEGDMLDSLEFKMTGDGVSVGIFDSGEVPKADGHNNFSGQSNLPTRRFIPDEKETFKRDIQSGIDKIIKENSVDESRSESNNIKRAREFAQQFVQALTVDDLFDNREL